ncbi:SDR family oxidoreductase [Pseudovibrio brasiliensis]|uniref:SDR family oxidoreductase n=1 Tax=Pseudovibrio brasiliensis TaxID=1898042 RepID=A0ABX8AME7_9HYPH|nr:SDR family oxidoreductase [Pseudovibrio brasiliensis]QUS54886.1 SDR family oxidoreductase [Pseudovibrio brasiliensis]
MTKPLVVITGASSGIGAAIARTFSKDGHPLLLLDKRKEPMVAMDLPNTICRKVDVTNREQMAKAIRHAEQALGPADAIVNNAGCMFLGELKDQRPEDWNKMIDVNLRGVFNGIHAVLQQMYKRGSGTIINIGSMTAKKPFPMRAAYGATKIAIHGLSEALRQEVAGHNVRVITIVPGLVETALPDSTRDAKIREDYEEQKRQIGGVLDPQNVADATLFAYNQPQNVNIRELVITATRQSA